MTQAGRQDRLDPVREWLLGAGGAEGEGNPGARALDGVQLKLDEWDREWFPGEGDLHMPSFVAGRIRPGAGDTHFDDCVGCKTSYTAPHTSEFGKQRVRGKKFFEEMLRTGNYRQTLLERSIL